MFVILCSFFAIEKNAPDISSQFIHAVQNDEWGKVMSYLEHPKLDINILVEDASGKKGNALNFLMKWVRYKKPIKKHVCFILNKLLSKKTLMLTEYPNTMNILPLWTLLI
jgi:hypothetical protein